jgi:uncharacterized protein YxeA
MNKNILIIIIVILLLGGGGFLFLNRSQTKPQSFTTKISNSPTNISTSKQKKSLRDLMFLAGNQQCTFFDKEAGSSGTVYAKSGNVRGDFQSQVNGKSTITRMIEDGTYIYFWTEGETKGYKASLAVIEKMSAGAVQQYQSQAFDMKKQADYSCSPWGVDSSKFVVPTSVEFTDYTSMMQNAVSVTEKNTTSNVTQGSSSACAACDSVPEAAKAQCKAALKCN